MTQELQLRNETTMNMDTKFQSESTNLPKIYDMFLFDEKIKLLNDKIKVLEDKVKQFDSFRYMDIILNKYTDEKIVIANKINELENLKPKSIQKLNDIITNASDIQNALKTYLYHINVYENYAMYPLKTTTDDITHIKNILNVKESECWKYFNKNAAILENINDKYKEFYNVSVSRGYYYDSNCDKFHYDNNDNMCYCNDNTDQCSYNISPFKYLHKDAQQTLLLMGFKKHVITDWMSNLDTIIETVNKDIAEIYDKNIAKFKDELQNLDVKIKRLEEFKAILIDIQQINIY
jgi:hypothetical protein